MLMGILTVVAALFFVDLLKLLNLVICSSNHTLSNSISLYFLTNGWD